MHPEPKQVSEIGGSVGRTVERRVTTSPEASLTGDQKDLHWSPQKRRRVHNSGYHSPIKSAHDDRENHRGLPGGGEARRGRYGGRVPGARPAPRSIPCTEVVAAGKGG